MQTNYKVKTKCATSEPQLTIKLTTIPQHKHWLLTIFPPFNQWRVLRAIKVRATFCERWQILLCQTSITRRRQITRLGKRKSLTDRRVSLNCLCSVNNSSSNISSSLNNVTSSIYTSNVNTNLVEQLNHHLTSSNNWRTVNSTNNSLSNLNLSNLNGSNRIQTSTNSLILTPATLTTTSSSLKRKSGAERLFAYFEADDSDDIELDYAR